MFHARPPAQEEFFVTRGNTLRKVRRTRRQLPATAEPPAGAIQTSLGAVAWLLAACVVGVVGSILLEGARVAAPLGLFTALAIVVPTEVVLYLLALGAGAPRLPRVRTTLGVFLGLLLRAALALILALVSPSPLAGEGLANHFLLFYARLWPAALVQVLALTAFLWLIRDLLVVPPDTPAVVSTPPVAQDDGGERQKELLAALLEPGDREPGPQLYMGIGGEATDMLPPERVRRGRRRRRQVAQTSLLGAEPPPAPPPPEQETALAAPLEPSPEDTAALPQVAGPSEATSPSSTPPAEES